VNRGFGPALVRSFSDARELAQAAAAYVARQAERALAERDGFRIALAGGSTPKALYAALAEPGILARVAWSRWQIWFSDERVVPAEDAASNYRMAYEALLGRVPIPKGAIHRVQTELGAERAAELYELELGADPCDLVLLGIGDDGHTASLFPGSPALLEDRRRVVAAPSPVAPLERVTFTFRALNEARAVLFLISGATKAERVAEVLSELAADRPLLPASRVRPRGSLCFYLDAAAAARLPAGTPPEEEP